MLEKHDHKTKPCVLLLCIKFGYIFLCKYQKRTHLHSKRKQKAKRKMRWFKFNRVIIIKSQTSKICAIISICAIYEALIFGFSCCCWWTIEWSERKKTHLLKLRWVQKNRREAKNSKADFDCKKIHDGFLLRHFVYLKSKNFFSPKLYSIYSRMGN